jgi:hypothetical protein
MPPRTRKTAEAEPPAPDTSSTPGAVAEETPQESTSQLAEGGSAEPAAPARLDADAPVAAPAPVHADEPATRPAPSYHWETPTGTPADPCRACPPGGPPPGAGSYGCPHGQWVRVQDTP